MLNIRKIMGTVGIAMLMSMSVVMTGCGIGGNGVNNTMDTSDLQHSVSMVMGVHDFFPAISLNTDSVYSQIYNACYTYGDVSAFVVDGNPYAVCDYQITKPDKNIDLAKRKQLATNNTKQIIAELSAASAKTPEIDTLTAISMSADALRGTSGEAERSMIIYDSGLSTTSLLNFATQNIIDEPAESLVSQLEERHAIPDLTGIDVVWVGIAQTCGEQESLPPSYKYKLQEIWKAILEAGGAASVTFDKSPLPDNEYSGNLPECTVVPVVTDSLDVAELVTDEEIPEVMKWDGNSNIKFCGNKAEFVDPDAAKKEMEPIASYLTSHPDDTVYIFGMTATSADDSGVELSLSRANACKDNLISAGVNENQIITIGMGQVENPLRTPDVDKNGEQIEELAQKNRAVIFVKKGSKLVDTLLTCVNQGGDI